MLPPQPPNWPPSLIFFKTGIILDIFFPSPKIGKRWEQLIWSSCWPCYLKIFIFFLCSNSLFGFPSHLYNLPPPHHFPLPRPHIHPLQNHPTSVQGMFLPQLPTTGIHLAEWAPPYWCQVPRAGVFTSCLVHILTESLPPPVSYSTSHPRWCPSLLASQSCFLRSMKGRQTRKVPKYTAQVTHIASWITICQTTFMHSLIYPTHSSWALNLGPPWCKRLGYMQTCICHMACTEEVYAVGW